MKIYPKYTKDLKRLSTIKPSRFVITDHAMDRLKRRVPLNSYKTKDIQKLLAKVKAFGIYLRGLNEDNCERFGISKDVYKEIKDWILTPYKKPLKKRHREQQMASMFVGNPHKRYTSTFKGSVTGKATNWAMELGEYPLNDCVIIYQGYLWFFTGSGNNTLRTVIEFYTEKEKKEMREKGINYKDC